LEKYNEEYQQRAIRLILIIYFVIIRRLHNKPYGKVIGSELFIRLIQWKLQNSYWKVV